MPPYMLAGICRNNFSDWGPGKRDNYKLIYKKKILYYNIVYSTFISKFTEPINMSTYYTGWGDQSYNYSASWTTCCRPAAAAIVGLWGARLAVLAMELVGISINIKCFVGESQAMPHANLAALCPSITAEWNWLAAEYVYCTYKTCPSFRCRRLVIAKKKRTLHRIDEQLTSQHTPTSTFLGCNKFQ